LVRAALRQQDAWRLLRGELPAAPARAFVLDTGARFIR
jgi:hypothetical protein